MYKLKGTLIHVETDEAIAQMKPEETDEEPEESASKTSTVVESSSQMSQANSQASGTAAVTADEKPKKKEKLIKNQFNYQDRGTQSGNDLAGFWETTEKCKDLN